MKLILSRKGFDSTSGGCASPILPDDRLRSLPIPCKEDTIKFSEIYEKEEEYSIGEIVKSLPSRLKCDTAHLDPDIDFKSIVRNGIEEKDWRGVFGQGDGAQTHLDEQKVKDGDLFLFYGWFRKTTIDKPEGLEFKKRKEAPDLHVIWGWLQIDTEGIVKVTKDNVQEIIAKYPWIENHPHIHIAKRGEKYKRKDGTPIEKSAIYIGKKELNIPGLELKSSLPGYGIFKKFKPVLQLTADGKSRSFWNPKINWLVENMSKHRQEHVCDISKAPPEITEWLQSIFDCAE